MLLSTMDILCWICCSICIDSFPLVVSYFIHHTLSCFSYFRDFSWLLPHWQSYRFLKEAYFRESFFMTWPLPNSSSSSPTICSSFINCMRLTDIPCCTHSFPFLKLPPLLRLADSEFHSPNVSVQANSSRTWFSL